MNHEWKQCYVSNLQKKIFTMYITENSCKISRALVSILKLGSRVGNPNFLSNQEGCKISQNYHHFSFFHHKKWRSVEPLDPPPTDEGPDYLYEIREQFCA